MQIFFGRFQILVIVLVGLLVVSEAAASSWNNTGPSHKDIRVVSISPQDTSVLFAGAFGWGVFKSTDAGNTWTSMKNGLTNTYVRSIYTLSNSIVFCGTNDGVFKTTDGGTTWSLVLSTSFSVRSLAYDLQTSNLYAATFGSGLYKSTNQGLSWSSITVKDTVVLQTLSHIWSIGVFGKDSLYVGGSLSDVATGGALFRSLDGGTSWIQVQRSTHIGSSVHAIAISPNTPSTSLIIGTATKGVYKSTNGGLNWLSINADTTTHPLDDLQINDVEFSSNYRFAGTDSLGGFYSRSLGDVSFGWASGAGLPGSQAVVSSIAINKSNESTLYLGTEGQGVFRSTNAGANWSARNFGMLGVAARVIERNGDGRLILGTDFGDGIWSSSDQGTTWNQSISLPTSNAITTIGITNNSSIVYSGAYGTGVFKSTDGGSTWSITDSTVLNHFVRTLSVHPSNSNLAYAGTGNGVYKTTNGGAAWQAVNSGIPASTSIRSMAIDPVDPTRIYVGTDSLYMFRTTDAGANWTNITSANGFLPQDIFLRTITIDYNSHTTLYAGSDSGRIYKSTDGAASWNIRAQLPSTHTVRSILIHPNDHKIFFVSTFGDGVFMSADSGVHWAAMNSGLTDLEIYTLETTPLNPLIIYAGSGSHGVYRTSFTFTNHTPVLAPIGNKSVLAGNQLRFSISASDSDLTIPVLSVVGLSSGASFTDSLNGHGVFTWSPTLPQLGVFSLTFYASDGSSSDSEKITIEVLDPNTSSAISVPVEFGWNLLSVPVLENDYRKTTIFPQASSTAFAYTGSYTVKDTLQNGAGYWLKFGSAQDVSFSGGRISRDTVAVSAGWNMVGSISSTFPVSTIAPIAPVAMTSNVFGYLGISGYNVADSIRPGRGYWVKVNQSGKVVMSSTPGQYPLLLGYSQPDRAVDVNSTIGVLTLRNIEGGTKELYILSERSMTGVERSELPPSPPGGSFDVRFSLTQSSAACVSQDVNAKLPIQILTGGTSIELNWNFASIDRSYQLSIGSGPDYSVYRLRGHGSMSLPIHDGMAHAILQHENESPGNNSTPKVFELHQNFPNPFNPITIITYDLPFTAFVRLAVFDVLGRKVKELVNVEQTSGSQSVTWSAENVSSGVYYYRIEVINTVNPAQSFHEMKKMFLIR